MGIKRFLLNNLHPNRNRRIRINELYNQLQDAQCSIENLNSNYRVYLLRDKTLHCHEPGISAEKYCEHEIIVSLTSFGNRIDKVHLAIESIMQGSIRPNHIVLWLAEDEFSSKRLPITLQKQQERGLEIAYCKDLKSYNKLIHSLKKYPNASIITIDDDVMYEYDLVERLVNAHISHPHEICACRMHRIVLDEKKQPVDYLKWIWCTSDNIRSPLNFPTGVGGVLYPPHCFNNEVLKSDIFLNICPKADDLWFYAMAQINNTLSIWVPTPRPDGYFFDIPYIGKTLADYNTDPIARGNDVQFKRILETYKIALTD